MNVVFARCAALQRLLIVRATVLSIAVSVSGCATNPSRLKAPAQITCINLTEPMSFTGHYGLLNMQWTTKLERGPYWSEKLDEKGTFYRAPPGGVSITGKNGVGLPGEPTTLDGGFYIPNSPNEPIRIYRYFSTSAASVQVPPEGASCSDAVFVKDPATSRVSLTAFAEGGALGGAAGGAIGRSIAGGRMSYGQAAGVGAAGGLVGGLIVGALINQDVGKIIGGLPIQDAQFMEKLRALANSKVFVNKSQIHAIQDGSQAGMK